MVITRLSADSAGTVELLGGKAAGLIRLLAAGLTVPEAWVIPAPVSLDADARERCLTELQTWWDEVTSAFPGSLWAVRSSAVAEDLDGASFAGVYETVLGLASLDEVRGAVRACWAAHGAERADVYRDSVGLDAGGGIALVLQRMVSPDVAGVMLTTNPRRPFADEIVIDAAWGLGEAIVSGKVDPDHIVLQRSTGDVRSVRVATKEVMTRYDATAGGLVDQPVPAGQQEVAVLGDDDLAQLYCVAVRVGDRIGDARDIEWAIQDGTVYTLQDRPITNLPNPDPANVWSRRWGDEYKSEYTMPLSSALTAPWMDIPMFGELVRLQGRADLADAAPFKTVNGYMYMDGQYCLRYARAFPKAMRAGIFGDWFTPLWLDRIAAEPWQPRHTLAMAAAPLRDPRRALIEANLAAMRRHCERIDAAILPKLIQDYAALDMTAWRRQLDEVTAFGLEHFRIIRWGMGIHNSFLHQGLAAELRSWAEDTDGQLYTTMISGLPGTWTARINAEIYDLAVIARADAELAVALRANRDYADVAATYPDSPLWAAMEVFLRNHGHRSSSREIASPRWREQPEVILGFVRVQVVSPQIPEDPRRSEQRAAQRRMDAAEEALRRAGRGPLGRARRRALAWTYQHAQQFTVYRENQRYHLDYLMAHTRGLVLEQGRRLVARGVLAELDDVFLLTGDEFWAAVSDRPATGDPIDRAGLEARRRNYLAYRERLPATYLFDDVETEGEIAEGDPTESDGDGISGLGASRGVARGITRCVADLSELAGVQAGEILVAKNIDPGWTSVFPLLSGLITETGGILSHGAILAREYGIPTVTGVAQAMELLPTGTLVDIDGSSGAVSPVEQATV